MALLPPVVAVAAAWTLLTATSCAAQADPLNAYAWTARPLLIFAPAAADPQRLAQRRALLTEADAMSDREMRLIEVLGDTAYADGVIAPFSAAELRRAYAAPAEAFAVLLIGKDSGVKLRAAAPTPASEIFALIDRMPMRRREMRERE